MEQAVEGALGVAHPLGKIMNATAVGEDAQPRQLLMGYPVPILNGGKFRRQSLSDPGGDEGTALQGCSEDLDDVLRAASQATAATAPLRRASA